MISNEEVPLQLRSLVQVETSNPQLTQHYNCKIVSKYYNQMNNDQKTKSIK